MRVQTSLRAWWLPSQFVCVNAGIILGTKPLVTYKRAMNTLTLQQEHIV